MTATDEHFMRLALRLARRGYGTTSPNPMVGAVLVKRGKAIGRGWHRRAGLPHAEIEALHAAGKRGNSPKGATLYVTLEPCCTHGRTPPCTETIIAAGIKRVVVAARDPNPKHAGRGFRILRRAGIAVEWWGERPREPKRGLTRSSSGASPHRSLADECIRLNEAFNHWIVHRTPFVTVKAAMTLDGKIATASGESKWITGEKARAEGMRLRGCSDAVLVGINTVLADDPALTVRRVGNIEHPTSNIQHPMARRVVLDSLARTPLTAKVVSDAHAASTTIIVSKAAPGRRVAALSRRVNVVVAPASKSAIRNPQSTMGRGIIDLRWLLRRLGREQITSLLVEGGGEVNASFLMNGLAQRVAFFYAPKVLGGRDARRGVAGAGARSWNEVLNLRDLEWRRLGADLMLSARVGHFGK